MSRGDRVEEERWSQKTIGVAYFMSIAICVYVGLTYGFIFAAVVTFAATFLGMLILQLPFELCFGAWMASNRTRCQDDPEFLNQAQLLKDKYALAILFFAMIIVLYAFFAP